MCVCITSEENMWVQAASTCHFWIWVSDSLLQGPEFMFTMFSDRNASCEFPRNWKVHPLGYFFVLISSLPVLQISLLWCHTVFSPRSITTVPVTYIFDVLPHRLAAALCLYKQQSINFSKKQKNNPENEELNMQMHSYLCTSADSRSCSAASLDSGMKNKYSILCIMGSMNDTGKLPTICSVDVNISSHRLSTSSRGKTTAAVVDTFDMFPLWQKCVCLGGRCVDHGGGLVGRGRSETPRCAGGGWCYFDLFPPWCWPLVASREHPPAAEWFDWTL